MVVVPVVLDGRYDLEDLIGADLFSTDFDAPFSDIGAIYNVPQIVQRNAYSDIGFSLPKVKVPKVVKAVGQAYKTAAKTAVKETKEFVKTSPLVQSGILNKAKAEANKVIVNTKAAASKIAAGTVSATNSMKNAANKTGEIVKTIAEHANQKGVSEALGVVSKTLEQKASAALKVANKATGAAKAAAAATYNKVKADALKAATLAANAAKKANELANKIKIGNIALIAEVKKGAAALTGKAKEAALAVGNNLLNTAKNAYNSAQNMASQLKNKAINAAVAFKDNLNDAKNAIMGEMAAAKNGLANLASAGLSKVRDEFSSFKNMAAKQISNVQSFVENTIKAQGEKIKQVAEQQAQYFKQIMAGQAQSAAMGKEMLTQKAEEIMTHVKDQAVFASKRFDTMEQGLNKATLERNVLKQDIVKKVEETQQATELKLRGAEERLVTHVRDVEDTFAKGMLISTGLIALLIFI